MIVRSLNSMARVKRRGVALVLVLALLALTLGFSYALLRSHTAGHELARNQSRKGDARTAAQAGMAVALRKLYDGSWDGADTSFSGDLTTDKLQGFTVTYTTGDSDLSSSAADWSEYPFRVTILSKGYSIDPITSTSRSEFSIRVVVQLIRRKLNSNLVSVAGLESYSIYQTGNNNVRIHHPIRLNGNVHVQGEIEFSRQYPQDWRGTEYMEFFGDLRKMYANHGWDYRPFSGCLYTPSSRQPLTGDVVHVLDTQLQVPRTNVAIDSSSPLGNLSDFSGYQLFAKGKLYSGEELTVSPDSQDVVPNADYLVAPGAYTASPLTNPLGVFVSKQGSIGFTSSTSLNGLVLAVGSSGGAEVHLAGQDLVLEGSVLPALAGDATTYRLPVIVAKEDVKVYDGTNRTINGWIVCGDEFHLQPGASSTTLTVNGGVFCSKLYLDHRISWVQTSSRWKSAYDSFKGGLLGLIGDLLFPKDYFPGWLYENRSSWGIYLTPRLIFNATPAGVTNHIPDFSQPIYVPHGDDGGLRWNVVKWQELGTP